MTVNGKAQSLTEGLHEPGKVGRRRGRDGWDESPEASGVAAYERNRDTRICVARQILFRFSRVTFLMETVALGEDAAKVRIPVVVFDQHDEGPKRRLGADGELAPDDETNALF